MERRGLVGGERTSSHLQAAVHGELRFEACQPVRTPPGSGPGELAEQGPGQLRRQDLIPFGDRAKGAKHRAKGCIRHDERRRPGPDIAGHILVKRLEAHEDEPGLRRRAVQRGGEGQAGPPLLPQIQEHEVGPGTSDLTKRLVDLRRGGQDMEPRLGTDPGRNAFGRQRIVVDQDQ